MSARTELCVFLYKKFCERIMKNSIILFDKKCENAIKSFAIATEI